MAVLPTLTADGQVPPATLRVWLAELELVEQRILSGEMVISSQYSSLGGGMGTTRQQVSLDAVRARKAEIRQLLGVSSQRRRAIGIRFG